MDYPKASRLSDGGHYPMSDAEPCPARYFHRSRVEERSAREMEQQEPLYRVQRLAREEAASQALVNLLRRLIGLPVKKTSKDAEFDVLYRRA